MASVLLDSKGGLTAPPMEEGAGYILEQPRYPRPRPHFSYKEGGEKRGVEIECGSLRRKSRGVG